MFKSPTLFVLGAGASKEVGLPTGVELSALIVEKLNFQFDHGRYSGGGDTAILRCADRTNMHAFYRAARAIRAGLPLFPSIDNFLNAHSDDPTVEQCGKLAIARCIVEKERDSALFVDLNQHPFQFRSSEIVFRSWFTAFQMLVSGIQKAKLSELLQNITVVSFNYDRCMKHFLLRAIVDAFGTDAQAAWELVNRLTVLHPYGSLGGLSVPGKPGVEFGGPTHDDADLNLISRRIRTFHEKMEDEHEINAIRDLVAEAHTLVFLGFGFNELNMQILTPDRSTKAARVFATAHGLSDLDGGEIDRRIHNLLQKTVPILRRNWTCRGMLDACSLSMNA